MIRRTQGITDVEIGNTGDGHDGANGSFTDLNFVQTVKLVELADLYTALLVRLMMVDKDAVLIDLDDTVLYFTDTDTSNVFVIVDGTDQDLGSGSLITFGSGDIAQIVSKRGTMSLDFLVRSRVAKPLFAEA